MLPGTREEGHVGESIVVGTDGSATAKRAVAEAVRLAKALDAQVHVVSAYGLSEVRAAAGAGFVMPPLIDDEWVAETLSEAAGSVGGQTVTVETHAVRAEPAEALLEVAEKVGASMIVVGNQGMHGAKRVLGSIPNSVSHRARCNVLIVSTDSD
jgi:nucleotide-binding universal stress UspA family protein